MGPERMPSGRLDFASAKDVAEFVAMLGRFERGAIGPDEWRAFRLVHGTYGQRQEGDLSMLRVKVPQGIVAAEQLEAIAGVAARHSRGFAHVTTRENVQLHFVRLGEIEPALGALAAVGLTTREACGNSLRNVTASPTAGVAADEVFDPSPYAAAFTRHFLRHPLSSSLPRKFKVAFAGGGADHAFAYVNDLGLHARLLVDGRRAFRVTAAGGTATLCTSGLVLCDALPAGELVALGEAVVRVFHAHGDRHNRHKNRMKFLVRALGVERFRALVDAALAAVRAEGAPSLPFPPDAPPDESRPPATRAPRPSAGALAALVADDAPRVPGVVPRYLPLADDGARARFLATNVRPQRQPGYRLVTVTLPLGDVSSGRMRALAALARCYGDGTLRLTPDQNVLLRWVPADDVEALRADLERIGLARPDPVSLADVGACPGAESCKLAVTQSRGVARLLDAHAEQRPDLLTRAPGLAVKVSGCPNGCGLHHVAGIGLQGGLRKVGGRPVPHYLVYVGGAVGADGARFGRSVAKVPARRVPLVIERLIELYEAGRAPGEDVATFLGRVPVADARRAIGALAELAPDDAVPEDFVDLEDGAAFTGATGVGECGA
ncbi:MAG: nitrite/sulfite reductase [Myxococcales bacterium]|nr:nitrite/sulfite reductase [Myxococcales bacterium]